MLIIVEMVGILQEFPRRDRDAKWAGAARKSVLMDLGFFKAVSVKLSKMRYVCKRGHTADSFVGFLWFKITFFRSSMLCISVIHFPFYFWVEQPEFVNPFTCW